MMVTVYKTLLNLLPTELTPINKILIMMVSWMLRKLKLEVILNLQIVLFLITDEQKEDRKVSNRSLTTQDLGLVTKESYDLLQSKLEEVKDTLGLSLMILATQLDPEKRELMWYGRNRLLHRMECLFLMEVDNYIHHQVNSPLFQSYIDKKLWKQDCH